MAPIPEPLDAVIFDLDGTLVDTAMDIRRALNEILERAGRRSLDLPAVKSMVGDGVPKLVERGFLARGALPDARTLAAAQADCAAFYAADPCRDSRPYPGILRLLATLRAKGQRLGVCTNKPKVATDAILEALGLADYFDCVIGGDSLSRIKPDPAPVLAVLDRLGVLPSASLFIGDSRNDLEAARAAGMKVWLYPSGYGRDDVRDLGADGIIEDFAELAARLA